MISSWQFANWSVRARSRNAIFWPDGAIEVVLVGVIAQWPRQAVKAFGVLQKAFELIEHQLMAHCLMLIENSMGPEALADIQRLPRTDADKICRIGLTRPGTKA